MNARTSRILLPILAAIAVAAIVLASIGTAIVFSVRCIRGYKTELEAEFVQSSHDSLAVFSTLSRTALLRGDIDSLEAMASLLLDSRAIFVQVVVGEREIISVLREGFSVALEPFPLLRFASGSIATIQSANEVLDLAIPIESADSKAEIVGYTRITFDAGRVAQLVGSRTRAVVSGNVILFVVLFAPLVWLARRHHIDPSVNEPSPNTTGECLIAGPLIIDLISKEVSVNGCGVHLTPKQFALLSQIARHPNRVFSDAELIAAIWPTSAYASAADVKQCVYTLRKRLAKACDDPSVLIVNVQGYGYKLAISQLDQDLTES